MKNLFLGLIIALSIFAAAGCGEVEDPVSTRYEDIVGTGTRDVEEDIRVPGDEVPWTETFIESPARWTIRHLAIVSVFIYIWLVVFTISDLFFKMLEEWLELCFIVLPALLGAGINSALGYWFLPPVWAWYCLAFALTCAGIIVLNIVTRNDRLGFFLLIVASILFWGIALWAKFGLIWI